MCPTLAHFAALKLRQQFELVEADQFWPFTPPIAALHFHPKRASYSCTCDVIKTIGQPMDTSHDTTIKRERRLHSPQTIVERFGFRDSDEESVENLYRQKPLNLVGDNSV